MTVNDLETPLQVHGPTSRAALLAGTYSPQPVRRTDIPTPGGGTRQLGSPTVLDRLIEHALLQGLQEAWAPTCSESSDGVRPQRSAPQAVEQAQADLRAGDTGGVDIALETCFGAPGQAWRFQRVRFPPRQGDRAAPPGIESGAQGGNDRGDA